MLFSRYKVAHERKRKIMRNVASVAELKSFFAEILIPFSGVIARELGDFMFQDDKLCLVEVNLLWVSN